MEKKRTKVYMAIPSTGNRSDAQCYTLRRIEKEYGDRVELVYPHQMVVRIFHDFARNEIVKEFLKTDCDILWFIDSDVVPAPHILDLITKHGDKWQVAGATYPVWMNNKLVFTVYDYDPERGCMHIIDAPRCIQETLDWVDGLATGCLMIKREVFEKLEQPYFEFKYNPETRELTEGEDLGFCKKLVSLGIKTFTDYSMVAKHYKTLDLLDVSNYTIDYANEKVIRYDASIRPQIEALTQRLLGKTTPSSQIIKPKLVLP